MKIQKISLAVLAAAGLLAFSIPAQADDTNSTAAKPPASTPPAGNGGGRGGMTAEARMESLTTALALTDEQKPKVKAVIDEQFKKMAELRADTSIAQEDRRAKMAPIREEATAKLKGILTEEQFKKYEALPQGGRGGPGGPRRTPGATNAPPQ